MDWQTIVVYLILAFVALWLVRAVWRGYVARKYSKSNTCDDASCPYHSKRKEDGR